MRLIDADRLLSEQMKNKYYHLKNGDTAVPLIDIKNAPTVDAVPVVRCKDCKNSEHWYGARRRCFLWADGGVSVSDDGFCNYAERTE